MVPVEVLLKATVNGDTPVVVLPVNCATGALYGTVAATSLENPLSV